MCGIAAIYNIKENKFEDDEIDLIEFISRWCSINDEKTSLIFLNEMKNKKEIFVGDFVKCCIKITNIIEEDVKYKIIIC